MNSQASDLANDPVIQKLEKKYYCISAKCCTVIKHNRGKEVKALKERAFKLNSLFKPHIHCPDCGRELIMGGLRYGKNT